MPLLRRLVDCGLHGQVQTVQIVVSCMPSSGSSDTRMAVLRLVLDEILHALPTARAGAAQCFCSRPGRAAVREIMPRSASARR